MEKTATYYDNLRYLREVTVNKMSSESVQMKIVSSKPALRQVPVLQQIQYHPVHCLLALIFNMYCMCMSTTVCFITFFLFIVFYSTAFSSLLLPTTFVNPNFRLIRTNSPPISPDKRNFVYSIKTCHLYRHNPYTRQAFFEYTSYNVRDKLHIAYTSGIQAFLFAYPQI
jgi:hypothetical protein